MTDITDAPAAASAPRAPSEGHLAGEPDTREHALPVVDDPDAGLSQPKEVRRQARRHFLQMMGAVGVGVGLAFTDVVSKRFLQPAGAAAYELWQECRGFFSSSTTCVPSSAYYGSDNCNGVWHREGRVITPAPIGTAVAITDYTHLAFNCDGRNAWLWRWRSDGWSTMCSDGRVVVRLDTGEVIFSSFSICRFTGYFGV